MKRAVRRGVLAALVTALVLEALLVPSGGGVIAYFFSTSHNRRPIDDVVWLLYVVGGFLGGLVNGAVSVSIGWLIIGLALMPLALGTMGLLFVALGFWVGWKDYSYLLLPLTTMIVTLLPSLLAKLFRRPSPLA